MSPPFTSSELLPVSPRPFANSPRLGSKGCHIPCPSPSLFSIPHLHGATTGWETPPPPHHRFVAPQSVYPSPTVSTRQSLHACPGSLTYSSHGSAGHIGGLHPHPNPTQPSSLSGLLLPKPTILFSGSPIRFQCGPIHFHQGHGLASPHPPPPGDQYPRLPRRYCPLASLPPHTPPTRGSNDLLFQFIYYNILIKTKSQN